MITSPIDSYVGMGQAGRRIVLWNVFILIGDQTHLPRFSPSRRHGMAHRGERGGESCDMRAFVWQLRSWVQSTLIPLLWSLHLAPVKSVRSAPSFLVDFCSAISVVL
jgi:hypothetical protein